MLLRRPVLTSSRMRIESPRAVSASTRCEPMKPAPPVTRYLMRLRPLLKVRAVPALRTTASCSTSRRQLVRRLTAPTCASSDADVLAPGLEGLAVEVDRGLQPLLELDTGLVPQNP